MSRKKKKRPSAPKSIADMGDETARDAAIQEDAARSGDSDAIRAEPIADDAEVEGETDPEEPPEHPPKPPSKPPRLPPKASVINGRAVVFLVSALTAGGISFKKREGRLRLV